MKAAAVKRDLTNIQKSMSEINDLANSATATPTTAIMPGSGQTATARLTPGTLKSAHPSIDDLRGMSSKDKIEQLQKKLRASLENLVDDDDDSNVIVTLPDDDDCPHNHFGSGLDLSHPTAAQLSASSGLSGSSKTIDTIKFQEKRMKTESKTKVVTDGYSSEQATSNSAEMKRLQAGDIDYKENKAASAMRNRLEVDGVKTEENAAVIKPIANRPLSPTPPPQQLPPPAPNHSHHNNNHNTNNHAAATTTTSHNNSNNKHMNNVREIPIEVEQSKEKTEYLEKINEVIRRAGLCPPTDTS
ncbi:GL25410 [Drosophila persimilis]|uniref:GL25410 n=1 Tax=Drosophila persimilis TaxID=7234 RepID=B4H8Q9_DROPE|nr:GL25410 [Drosophila persimilis]